MKSITKITVGAMSISATSHQYADRYSTKVRKTTLAIDRIETARMKSSYVVPFWLPPAPS